ncbi:hypothetical protein [Streptomyces flavidovirens]|uniref:hypothetical protein n=1 Tax=Streptomyces flavidovirens TaxID=67298 RepID=UPI00048A72A3|nr:hypothetical protein [Streptomyces flavidovirens]
MSSNQPSVSDRFVGEYRELGHGRSDGPSLHAAVRDEGGQDEKSLARYLREGAALAATGTRVHDVLSPEHELIGGLSLLTDGQWFWYSDLAHYVERYHVTLDERFIQHARSRNWSPPQLTNDELVEIEEAMFDDEGA